MPLHTITTYAAQIPPVVIAALIALCYAYVAGGRWAWPMTLDAGLLGLYLWRPSFGMLAFVLLLGGVRHVPALAREVVVLFRLHEFDGWTLHLVMFALPALRAYAHQSVPARDLPPIVAPAAPQPIKAEADLPLLLGDGLAALNTDPTAPHVGVIGATRLGKTTFVGVLLSYRESELVIATPKAAQYDPWFGADVARPIADAAADTIDYAPIEQAISRVHQEMLRRNTPGASATPPITLVVDEWTQVVSELPGLAKKVINLLRMGAGCGIRLILMATDVNVRGWKMDGSAGVLDNLVFAKVEDGRKWSIGRLDANWRLVSPRALDTTLVAGLAARVSLAGRGWAGARCVAPAGAGGLLGGLLAQSVGASAGVPVPSVAVGGSGGNSAVQTDRQTQTDADQRIAMYRTWRAAGIKRDQARLIRQGMGEGLDGNEWADAGKETT